jgi:WD40 repeat protein
MLGRIAYSPSGDSLDGEVAAGAAAGSRIVSVQFGPTRIAGVPGSVGVGKLNSIAIAPNGIIVFSGSYGTGKDHGCGVFLLDPAVPHVRKVLDQAGADCRYAAAWLRVSVSPDGLHAVAVRGGELAVIDLVSGAIKSIGTGFQEANWSPDGQWLAALVDGDREEAVLFDARTVARGKVLKISGAKWSPDSRFLLGLTSSGCGSMSYAGTLETVEVASGKRAQIESSHCRVNQATFGWIRAMSAQ